MMKLSSLLAAIHVNINLSSAYEIKEACELIIDVQDMNSGERDCIRACYRNGPLWDGDVPCKSSRDYLVRDGYLEKVVVKGEDGFNACTSKGALAYNILKEMGYEN